MGSKVPPRMPRTELMVLQKRPGAGAFFHPQPIDNVQCSNPVDRLPNPPTARSKARAGSRQKGDFRRRRRPPEDGVAMGKAAEAADDDRVLLGPVQRTRQ